MERDGRHRDSSPPTRFLRSLALPGQTPPHSCAVRSGCQTGLEGESSTLLLKLFFFLMKKTIE